MGLDTVKKGTPLYGQPDWWGEDQEQGSGSPEGARGERKSPAYIVHNDIVHERCTIVLKQCLKKQMLASQSPVTLRNALSFRE